MSKEFEELEQFFSETLSEVAAAREKFPDSGGSMTALTEEVGELAKAMLDESSDRVRREAIQVACMAARVALEGDPTLAPYRTERGAGPHPDSTAEQRRRSASVDARTTKPVAYIAHQLSGDREANRAAAAKWVAWAGKQGVAPVATWIVLAGEWDEETGRDLGLDIDRRLIERCDVVLLCGPRLSGGMQVEAEHAQKVGVPILNLVRLNFETAEPLVRRLVR